MGAFDVVPNIVIPDPDKPEEEAAFRKKWGWERHEQVIMRGSFSAGDQEAVGNAATVTDKKGNMSYQAGTGRLALLGRMIVDWTFTAGGRKVPVTPDAIRRLPSSYTTPLLEKCDELAQGMTEEEQENFFASANGHISENSVETSLSLLQ